MKRLAVEKFMKQHRYNPQFDEVEWFEVCFTLGNYALQDYEKNYELEDGNFFVTVDRERKYVCISTFDENEYQTDCVYMSYEDFDRLDDCYRDDCLIIEDDKLFNTDFKKMPNEILKKMFYHPNGKTESEIKERIYDLTSHCEEKMIDDKLGTIKLELSKYEAIELLEEIGEDYRTLIAWRKK